MSTAVGFKEEGGREEGREGEGERMGSNSRQKRPHCLLS